MRRRTLSSHLRSRKSNVGKGAKSLRSNKGGARTVRGIERGEGKKVYEKGKK